MSNGFQLLCSTTTVLIIDTLFQVVSSGIKIFFISQVMNYLLPVHTISVRHASCYAFKRVIPVIPVPSTYCRFYLRGVNLCV
jgi:hypothetical protein